MALRYSAYRIVLFFYLLLLMCDHGSGARDVTKQEWKQYAAAYSTKQDAKDSVYVAAYGTKQGVEESGNAAGYKAAYRTKQDVKDSYITSYNTKEDSTEHWNHANGVKGIARQHLNQPYIAGYTNRQGHQQVEMENQKEMNQPYIAGYTNRQGHQQEEVENQKEMNQPYIAGYTNRQGPQQEEVENQKEMNQPYIAGYTNRQGQGHQKGEVENQNEMNQPYIAGYTNRQGHQQEEMENNYIAQYGTKKAMKDTKMENREHGHQQEEMENQKEMNQPYIAGYTNRQGHQQEEIESQKEMNQPYIAGYTNRRANYITREDVKDNYIAQYGTKKALKDTEMENKKHCGQQVVANQEEMKQPYIAGYKNREANYKTGYGGRGDEKDSYIAGYINTQDVKELDDSHENQMAAKPSSSSSHMDHSKAFKFGFFTFDDLYVGRTMAVHFPIQEFPHFLPRGEADSIPFSMPQLPNVLQLFSIPADSPNAKAMKDTLMQCESLPIKGEIKLCATSLESMLDFVNNIMGSGTNLNVLTTKQFPTMPELTQNYSVLTISEEIHAPKWVACHPLPYSYKVFYCHFIENSKIFKVSLGGENGQKVEAVAVCHMDTSDWDPDNILFRQLGIKPSSSSPICHFLPVYHLVWVPSPTTASI